MKVGILTFSFSNNYGAILQCLALQNALNQMKIKTYVINYHPEVKPKPFWQGWGIRSNFIKGIADRFIDLSCGTLMRRKFDKFRGDFIQQTAECRSCKEVDKISRDFEALIVGSDQVWNFNLYSTRDQAQTYFLDLPNYTGLKISYAACCGQPNQPQQAKEIMQSKIPTFDAISVRNELTLDLVASYGAQNVEVVCDPSLLIDFDMLLPNKRIAKEKYIFFYGLSNANNPKHKAVLDRIRKKVGNLKVIAAIPSAHKKTFPFWADKKIWCASPIEWISLIRNAQFVYTDSFHGMLFSLKYRVPFLSYFSEQWRSSRLIDVANRYCLNKTVFQIENEPQITDIDFEKAFSKIADHKDLSITFLRQALCIEKI